MAGVGRSTLPGVRSGGNVVVAELEEPRRAVEVLEPVQAEIAERLAVEERRGRRREHDLAAVCERCDARAAVDVDPDVALARQRRRARVQAHAHARSARPRAPRWPASAAAAAPWRRRESDEERVALGVDLDAAVRDERIAKDTPVLRECLGVRVRAERVQQPRRALDVGEEERDGSAREIGAHRRVIDRTTG